MSLTLYPHVGTLGSAAGRTAILLPPFTGEWSALPALTMSFWSSVEVSDDADVFGVDPAAAVAVADDADPFGVDPAAAVEAG